MKTTRIVTVVMMKIDASITAIAVTEMMKRIGMTRTEIANDVDDTETMMTMIPGRGTKITTITTIDPTETAIRSLKLDAGT
jgi:hypothetical protein